MITTILDYRGAATGYGAGRGILTATVANLDVTIDGRQPSGTSVPPGLLEELAKTPGIDAVVPIHVEPARPSGPMFGPAGMGIASCAELARIPALGRCQAGATSALLPLSGPSEGITSHASNPAHTVLPAGPIPGDRLASLPVSALEVSTDGSAQAIERARTAIEKAYPYGDTPTTIGEISVDNAQLVKGWQQLATVAIVASLIIAACSLAVGVASSLVERKRPFSLLRLTGTPLGVLRRVVVFEAAVPLLLVAVTAAASGLLAAHLFLRSQLDESLRPLGAGYYLAVGLGLTLALVIIAASLPLLRRITGPETARNE
jgi:hypothetical protein